MNLLKAALRAVNSLPPLPSGLMELSRLMQQAFPETEAVTQIVARDPALTAAVLRVANSAASAPKHEVTEVRRAVMQLGVREAGRIGMTAAFSGVMPAVLPGYRIPRDTFVQHCMEVGLIAEHIVKALDLPTFADAFTGGLLHDCGKLVLCRFVEMKKADMFSLIETGSRWVDGERALLGMDHTILGEALAHAWKLPESLASCNRWHHTPSAMPAYQDENLCVAVHLANEVAHQLAGDDASVDDAVPSILGVPESLLQEVMLEAGKKISRLRPAAVPKRSASPPTETRRANVR